LAVHGYETDVKAILLLQLFTMTTSNMIEYHEVKFEEIV